jgi:hypothetical protein
MAVSNSSPNVDNYYIGKGALWWKGIDDDVYRDVGNAPEFEYNPAVEMYDHFSARRGVKFKDKSVVRQKTATVRMILEEFTADNLALYFMAEQAAAVTLATTADTHSSTVLDNITSTVGLVVGNHYLVTGVGIPGGTGLRYDGGSTGTLTQAATATGTGVSVSISSPIQLNLMSKSSVQGSVRFVGDNEEGPPLQMDIPSVILRPQSAIQLIGDDWGKIELSGEVTGDVVTGSFGTLLWNAVNPLP